MAGDAQPNSAMACTNEATRRRFSGSLSFKPSSSPTLRGVAADCALAMAGKDAAFTAMATKLRRPSRLDDIKQHLPAGCMQP
jgi:hypothetical protein